MRILRLLVACRNFQGTFRLEVTLSFSTVKGQTQSYQRKEPIDFEPKSSVHQLAPTARELLAFGQSSSLLLEDSPADKEISI